MKTKKVFVSNETNMVLEGMKNIDVNHVLYDSFYEEEVDNDFHVNVFGNARVYDDARVSGNAEVSGNARVYDDAIVSGNARVYRSAIVSGNAEVFGNAEVSGNVKATSKVLNVIGLPYNITITDNHIAIGCKQFDFETARKLAERNIDIDEDDYKKMIKYKDVLLNLIEIKEKELRND